ncbi:Blue light-and temperature-regulated antirepressor YcgF [Marinomonas gallaica]|uniref:Blue light-and temperature-regulated antirepressor YcgF n=1 Tax=Marinomonas gallaica TaxID=1806667 RepID=A0A1C3JVP6_9GAMM|nr:MULTISPECIES: BLUF domain-containing protein [Marinomonas]MCO4785418.1 BLUF domain-containing protein [Marinomonas atlantica]SBT19172.1 Blue light-and temperature-regulated antirepressor YcgF [Marinomonas gallaica]SBT20861.1 Blue light-and temperature-regulated antirepressor YcgF [Marinomonas gallaica]
MNLVRLIYASRATAEFKPSSIESILKSARFNNQRNSLTGLLCFNQHWFLQCLEGPRDQVCQTYARILSDPRHENVQIIGYDYTTQRDFDGWNMGYLQDNAVMRDLIRRRTGSEKFSPLSYTPDDAIAIVKDVRDLIASILEEES